MKYIAIAVTIVLLLTILFGVAVTYEQAKPNKGSVYPPLSHGVVEGYSTIVIDSCEYIEAFNRLAHKGNCKFCAERRREDISKFIERIKK